MSDLKPKPKLVERTVVRAPLIAFHLPQPEPVSKAELQEISRQVLKLAERRTLLSEVSEELRYAWTLHKSEERDLKKRRLAIAERLARGADVL